MQKLACSEPQCFLRCCWRWLVERVVQRMVVGENWCELFLCSCSNSSHKWFVTFSFNTPVFTSDLMKLSLQNLILTLFQFFGIRLKSSFKCGYYFHGLYLFPQCRQARRTRSEVMLLWKNNIPIMVEVMLLPDCCYSDEGPNTEGSDLNDPAIKQDALLLERWILEPVPRQ